MTPNTPENTATQPPVWYRQRHRTGSGLGTVHQRLFAPSTFFANLPRKSIMSLPGNRYQPVALGDKFKKGALCAAKVAQRFFDRSGKGFFRLTTGTIVASGETRASLSTSSASSAN